ncbi:hypothetical protein T492DRAFT_1023682, partial [Pavlovales sp. CCMP2436]
MEPASAMLGVLDERSPLDERMLTLRQRSLLAHTAADDLIVWDAQEQLIRAAARGGADTRPRAWRPQLAPPSLLRAHPSFLTESAERQQQLLAALAPRKYAPAEGGLPFEVLELLLADGGAYVALVGFRSVAVVALHVLDEEAADAATDALPCYAVLVGEEPAPADGVSGALASSRAVRTLAAATAAAAARKSHLAGGSGGTDSPGSAFREARARARGEARVEALDALVGARWHPLSPSHLVLLRASGTLCMFDVCTDASSPELELQLQIGSELGASRAGRAAGQPRARALALGEGCGPGWASVTAYIAADDGSIFALCPLLPRCPQARWHVMRLAREVRPGASAAQRRWLSAFARELAAGGADGGDEELGCGLGRARPMLQGPLPVVGADAAAGAALAALDEAEMRAPVLERLRAARSWISLLPDPVLPDQIYVRDCFGVHVLHLPWLGAYAHFLNPELNGGAEAGEQAMADCPDCPRALGHTRPMLPSEASLLSAAVARRERAEGGARGRRAALNEEEALEKLPFSLKLSGAAGCSLEVRPQLLGAVTCYVPLGSGGPRLYAIGADGTVHSCDLSASPPAPPPPVDEQNASGRRVWGAQLSPRRGSKHFSEQLRLSNTRACCLPSSWVRTRAVASTLWRRGWRQTHCPRCRRSSTRRPRARCCSRRRRATPAPTNATSTRGRPHCTPSLRARANRHSLPRATASRPRAAGGARRRADARGGGCGGLAARGGGRAAPGRAGALLRCQL